MRDLAAEHGTPAYVLDEDDFRARCRDFAAAFAGRRRVLRRQGVPLQGRGPDRSPRRACYLDVCTGGELAIALAAGIPGRADRLARQQQVGRRAEPGARRRRRPDRRRLVRRDRPADRAGPRARRRGPRVLVRVTVGVEAHTHEFIATAHEDQKFGFSLAGGAAFAAAVADPRRRRAGAARAAHAHRLADLRHRGLRGGRPAGPGAAGADPRRARGRAARAGPGRRLRHRVHHPGRPVDARRSGQADLQDRRARVRSAASLARAAPVGRAGPGHRRPRRLHALRGRHGQGRRRASAPTSASTAG